MFPKCPFKFSIECNEISQNKNLLLQIYKLNVEWIETKKEHGVQKYIFGHGIWKQRIVHRLLFDWIVIFSRS